MYDTILIPTDGSEGAEVAAQHGRTLAAAFDSRIHVLSVVDERSYSSDLTDLDPAIWDQREMLKQQAIERVVDIEDIASDSSITCHTAVEHEVPHESNFPTLQTTISISSRWAPTVARGSSDCYSGA
ncbi:universal stress protein [Salinirubellus sp. GCM10025818]|uniref:universal stress protein n=1 Tax=Salinirubellus TaxID=2162630 RepID=UPI0030CD4F0F